MSLVFDQKLCKNRSNAGAYLDPSQTSKNGVFWGRVKRLKQLYLTYLTGFRKRLPNDQHFLGIWPENLDFFKVGLGSSSIILFIQLTELLRQKTYLKFFRRIVVFLENLSLTRSVRSKSVLYGSNNLFPRLKLSRNLSRKCKITIFSWF